VRTCQVPVPGARVSPRGVCGGGVRTGLQGALVPEKRVVSRWSEVRAMAQPARGFSACWRGSVAPRCQPAGVGKAGAVAARCFFCRERGAAEA